MAQKLQIFSLVIGILAMMACKSDAKSKNPPAETKIETVATTEEISSTEANAGSEIDEIEMYDDDDDETSIEQPTKSENTNATKSTADGMPSDQKVKAQPTKKDKTKVDKPITVAPSTTSSNSNPPSKQQNPSTTTKATTTVTPPAKSEPNPPVLPTETKTEKPVKPPMTGTVVGLPNHKLFDKLLNKYVTAAGLVDYSALKSNVAQLDAYIATLETSNISSTWSREEKLAFWINAYNAYTIKLILNNYPVQKITDLHGGKPWDHKWIKLDGKTLSLNNIENDIIRPTFKDPRIHFAVNCAAKSCPPLLNAAFEPSTLSAQLESQTKKFINNPKYNTLDKSAITVSKIFDWYGVDFGDVATYIAKYASTIVKPSATVSYSEYDWSLNGK